MNYEVFGRKTWVKVGREFRPKIGRRTHICYVETIQEAREICADGPANKARDAGKEYRHLSFYEFTEA